jgi:hypothetical protein
MRKKKPAMTKDSSAMAGFFVFAEHATFNRSPPYFMKKSLGPLIV